MIIEYNNWFLISTARIIPCQVHLLSSLIQLPSKLILLHQFIPRDTLVLRDRGEVPEQR